MRIDAEDAKDGIVNSAPLQQHIVFNAIIIHCLLQGGIMPLFAFLRDRIIGHHQGGQRLAAPNRCIEHGGQPRGQIIKFMVAEGGGIITHGAHHPQFQRGGGIGGLEKGAHGKIAAIYQDRIGVLLFLRFDRGH